jgi:transposase InsO family protein
LPFREVSAMAEKQEFVSLARAPGANMRALCRRFGISPTVGYKWLARFETEGAQGLAERSRRPRCQPARTPGAIEAAVLKIRRAHPAWGGRKIAARLKAMGKQAPAPSTVTEILRRHGEPIGAHGGGQKPFIRFEREAPNDLWQMDFKGHVAMAKGRLHPLTVLDDHSRFALVLEACADERAETVQTALIGAFRRYGLPRAMITDNGGPWGGASTEARFTRLSVFLMEQDIRVTHARAYHPQTMGKDERFHRSLNAEVLSGPPFADLPAAARALARWREVYNFERPHQALGLAPPIARYAMSPRAYRETVEPFAYAPDDQVRRVDSSRVSFQRRRLLVPKAFQGKEVALRPTGRDGVYHVFFRSQQIAELDLHAITRQD